MKAVRHPRIQQQPPRLSTGQSREERRRVKYREPFYVTMEWRRLIKDIIRKRGRHCELCGARNARIFGDHRLEMRDGGDPFDEDNVQLLCGTCHVKKTLQTRAERMKRNYG